MTNVNGIHHITAIAGDPQENLDFYSGVLGMRLVKKSINQDVPDTYHLFFADGQGNPGTDLTFFPWPRMATGRRGLGVWGEVSFSVPEGSLEYWQKRLQDLDIDADAVEERFGEKVLPFRDPHGMALSLTESSTSDDFAFQAWDASPVPADRQIRALGSVRLPLRGGQQSLEFLQHSFGFTEALTDGAWRRFTVGQGAGGQRLDIRLEPDAPRGSWGTGSVHHVAFRARDDEHELSIRKQISEAGGHPTEVIDRFWFKSVYVREPSGALCEVATDGPGFAVDEDPGHLGEKLVLPPWYEPQREAIESLLPPLKRPQPAGRT